VRLVINNLLLTLLLVCFANVATAEETSFARQHLPFGISIEIPSHWNVLSRSDQKNIAAAGDAMLEDAGIEGPSGKKESLLVVKALPEPAGAIIRVSAIRPPEFTQAELASLTESDLIELRKEMAAKLKKLEASGGPKILEVYPLRVEKMNNYLIFVMSYTKRSTKESSLWLVTQYKIPTSNRLVEVTLSHRQSDSIVWKPILGRVKRSLRF